MLEPSRAERFEDWVMDSFWRFLPIMLVLIVAIVLFFAAIIMAIAKPIEEASCNQKGAQYDLPADFRLLSDTCYVQVPGGRWINVDTYRVFQRSHR